MFKHLLVPLDGSSLAEVILPAARSLGSRLPARVTLLHVVEPSAPATIHGYKHLGTAAEAQDYLKRIARQFEHTGAVVDWHVDVVERGDVAKTIFAHCGELDADLVMLTSHGASGLREIMFGSIAQQVLQSGRIPVFILRPDTAPPSSHPGRFSSRSTAARFTSPRSIWQPTLRVRMTRHCISWSSFQP